MPTRFSVVFDDDRAREIEDLARQYELTEEEVLRQLLDLGLDVLEDGEGQTPRSDETQI
ncbi:CopG family transcriptional regulator [Halorhabdus rudnickae]|uniref:CopG family transcriptional regulator n=1 Tax=Halorhabdus rudnickae TaxID=1775544 RepID=UPI001082D1F0|nr:CopG family transcriptional regulator [Halorhabdus rudnickae]